MKKKFFNKSKDILRRALAIMLCLIIVSASFVCSFADATDNYSSYKWTRIDSEDELRKYIETGRTDRDGDRKFIDKAVSKDVNDDDINHWFKALIAYKVDGREYIFAGDSMVPEKYVATRVLPSYFYSVDGSQVKEQHIGDETLNSISSLYAPFVKFAGEDSDNEDSVMLQVRFADRKDGDLTGADTLSQYILAGNISWYGIANAAAAYGELKSTRASNPTSHEHGAACDSTIQTAITLKWTSGKFQAYYNIKGAADRWWAYSDRDAYVELCKSPDLDCSSFYLYLGVPTPATVINSSQVLEQNTTTFNTLNIAEKVMIEVPKGSCLVMEGLSIVKGSIIVNGGTLIVRGTVDTTGLNQTDEALTDAISPGTFKITNGGCMFVEDTGVMCLRLPTSNLILEKGSTCTISGSCVVTGTISISESTLSVRPGAVLIHGAYAPAATGVRTLGKAYVKEHPNDSLAAYVVNTQIGNDKYKSAQGGMEFGNYATFDVRGLYYRYSPSPFENISIPQNSYSNAIMYHNINVKISDMMREW